MRAPVGPPGVPRAEPSAGLSADLLADLGDWRLHLGARSYTAVSVDMLLRNLRRAVPSALGYTLVLVLAPGLPEVSITVADGDLGPDEVLATVTFDLPVAADALARVTFYAGERDALDRLATLVGGSVDLGCVRVELGGSPAVGVPPGVRGLADHTRVSHAIGVLLARGCSYRESEDHLRLLADRLGSLEAAAEHLLATFNA